jgi:uncharacterized protein YdhG (YjbR/CyaY superfamily)
MVTSIAAVGVNISIGWVKEDEKMSSNEIDAYLGKVPDEFRTALEKLRKTIRTAAPDAVEVLSYGVPAFKENGMLVSFGAAKNHCAFYLMSPAVMEAFKDELKGYATSKGTIRFLPDKPLPADLVKILVKARIKENEERASKR